jgi:hypothetical protein
MTSPDSISLPTTVLRITPELPATTRLQPLIGGFFQWMTSLSDGFSLGSMPYSEPQGPEF